MAFLTVVLNEWLFHDINGENGNGAQKFAGDFLERLVYSDCKIVYRRGSPWALKAFSLMKSEDLKVRKLSKLLFSIIKDSEKCIYLPDINEALHSNMLSAGEVLPDEDIYLVDMAIEAGANYLVTTDEKLKQAVNRLNESGRLGVKAIGKNEFLNKIS